MPTAKQLKELFEHRDAEYHERSENIADQIGFVFESVVEVLKIDPATLEWEGIDIFDTTLVLIGKIVASENEVKLVTVGIPMYIVERGSKEFLINFLLANNNEYSKIDTITKPREQTTEEPDTDVLGPVGDAKESYQDYVYRGETTKRTIH